MSWFWVFFAVIMLLQVLEVYWQHQEKKALKEYTEERAKLITTYARDEVDQKMLL